MSSGKRIKARVFEDRVFLSPKRKSVRRLSSRVFLPGLRVAGPAIAVSNPVPIAPYGQINLKGVSADINIGPIFERVIVRVEGKGDEIHARKEQIRFDDRKPEGMSA